MSEDGRFSSILDKLEEAVKSRTVWTIVILIAYNLLDTYSLKIDADTSALINVVLGAFATYFRVVRKPTV